MRCCSAPVALRRADPDRANVLLLSVSTRLYARDCARLWADRLVIGRNVDAPTRLLHVQEQVVRRRAADVADTECLRKEIHAHPHVEASFGCEISGRTIVGEQHRACILRVPQEQVNGVSGCRLPCSHLHRFTILLATAAEVTGQTDRPGLLWRRSLATRLYSWLVLHEGTPTRRGSPITATVS